jgi:hypothetical protein
MRQEPRKLVEEDQEEQNRRSPIMKFGGRNRNKIK